MKKEPISQEELSNINGGITKRYAQHLQDGVLYSIDDNYGYGRPYKLTKEELLEIIDKNPTRAEKLLYVGPAAMGDRYEEALAARTERQCPADLFTP